MLVNNTLTARASLRYMTALELVNLIEAAAPEETIHIKGKIYEPFFQKKNLHLQEQPNKLSVLLTGYAALDTANKDNRPSLECDKANLAASTRRAKNFNASLIEIIQLYEERRMLESCSFATYRKKDKTITITADPSIEHTTENYKSITTDYFRTLINYASKLKESDTNGTYAESLDKAIKIIQNNLKKYVDSERIGLPKDIKRISELRSLGITS